MLTAERERISAPFFYNPGFDAMIEPLPTLTEKEAPLYHPCCWGYFRAVRFAGDFTDIGIEIQISHFEKGGKESGSSDRKEEEEEEEKEEEGVALKKEDPTKDGGGKIPIKSHF